MLPPNLRCFVSVLFLLKSVNSKSVCTEEEHKESARAFINCVESAKARIILTQQNATDEQLVCESLENMLDGCEKQINHLATCAGRHHVENLKAIHLSSITDVIKAINHQVNVASCSVYTEKTLISGTSEESNAVSHHQQQPPQPQVVYSSASKSEVLLSFWLLSAVMSLSCAFRD